MKNAKCKMHKKGSAQSDVTCWNSPHRAESLSAGGPGSIRAITRTCFVHFTFYILHCALCIPAAEGGRSAPRLPPRPLHVDRSFALARGTGLAELGLGWRLR